MSHPRLRAILEGGQRLDVRTLIRLPSSSATFPVPAVGALRGLPLPQNVLLMLLARGATCAVTVVAVRRALPDVRSAVASSATLVERGGRTA